MADYDLTWDDNAIGQLERRDRFTRHSIRDEVRRMFESAGVHDIADLGLEIDPTEHEHVTGVSDDRFLIVWRLDEPRKQAKVLSILPNTNIVADKKAIRTPADLDKLKEQLDRMRAEVDDKL